MKTEKVNGKHITLENKEQPGRDILLNLIDQSEKENDIPAPVQNGIYIGILKEISSDGHLVVEIPDLRSGIQFQACAACPIDQKDAGERVALSFPVNSLREPLVLGVIRNGNGTSRLSECSAEKPEKLVIDAGSEITLQCGKSSVTLTKAGKIIIRGEYISSCSTGMHRIKGGAVHIN